VRVIDKHFADMQRRRRRRRIEARSVICTSVVLGGTGRAGPVVKQHKQREASESAGIPQSPFPASAPASRAAGRFADRLTTVSSCSELNAVARCSADFPLPLAAATPSHRPERAGP
jgi:hypothetical protein